MFYVLKDGETHAAGPFSKAELEEFLSSKRVTADDYVFYEGLSDWRLISDIFDFQKTASDFLEDGQDKETVSISFTAVSERIKKEEEILYIAVQALAAEDRVGEILQSVPQSVVLTTERISIIEPKLIGDVGVIDHFFNDVEQVTSHVNRRNGGWILKIELKGGKSVNVESLPEHQVSSLIETAAEIFRNRQD